VQSGGGYIFLTIPRGIVNLNESLHEF